MRFGLLVLACLVAVALANNGNGDGNGHNGNGHGNGGSPNPFTQKSAIGGFSPRRAHIPSSFDYIVVGGGTAGAVVANRLSANSNRRVLLLEKGVDRTGEELYQIPRNWETTVVSPADDFTMIDFHNEPVVNWDETKSRVSLGKAFGGGSLINAEMFVRGNPKDYDIWAAGGATGWSYDDVLPYFKRVETNTWKASINPEYHGTTGPLKVTPSSEHPPEDQLLVAAAAAAGYPFNDDINGPVQMAGPKGCSAFHDMTLANGVRQDSYTAYIKPILSRSNLYVVDSALVTKVNFNNHKRAVSVSWFDTLTGQNKVSTASREIVLSAGAIQTPKLLQLSGVGDADHLSSLNIPVVKNLPGVGENLMDHIITNLGYNNNPPLPTPVHQELTPETLAEWRVNRTGPYSSIGGRTLFMVRTSNQAADDPRPDIQVIGYAPGFNVFGAIYLVHPKSRGSVKILSSDPTDKVLPVGNFLSHPSDVASFVAGLRAVTAIYEQLPGELSYSYSSPEHLDDDWNVATYVTGYAPWQKGVSNTGNHWAGTAKMGPASDPTAVVSPRLRVHGVSGLRVADASIMPSITSGNIQAPVYMIGEKAAQMILDDN